MKQIILVGMLVGLLSAAIPLRAQVAQRDSDARKGSRLELGRTTPNRKTNTATLPGTRFTLVPKPSEAGLDRGVNLRKNAPINEHYRTLLVARPAAKSASRTSASPDVTPVVSAERNSAPAVEGKAEDRLFANEKIWVSNVYPNPADDVAEVDYQFSNGASGDARLVLLNVLGSPVAEYVLDRSDRKARLVTRDLSTGYYLYQLSVDGRKVATKRLLVRHQ
ncbi:T9SS type A sorting domain-containing protein [Spirosoma montaniterrae]|uniref:Secretion system C-terminal sorting domain-containing protein n=1 Tax=Spirosoma montaniterrae TaxID=1178516 RepID=A0A1P9WX80_9BACT|nr:T9SS type A sorting domain-containing protein [Spirosoma montaniterrae]AQG79985.1 hypothetical protein AWR27_12000 [Spirosoma montaniterrae]